MMKKQQPNIKEVLCFDDKLLMLVGIPVVTMIMSLIYFPHMVSDDPSVFWRRCVPVSFIYTVVFWVIFRMIIYGLLLKFPKRKDTGKRVLVLTVAIVFFYFLIKTFLHQIIHYFFGPDFKNDPIPLTSIIVSLVISFMVIAIYEAIRFYTLLLNAETEKEKLEKENVRSVLNGLRNQINPHFLFNNLNTLSYLIPEDAHKAPAFIKKF